MVYFPDAWQASGKWRKKELDTIPIDSKVVVMRIERPSDTGMTEYHDVLLEVVINWSQIVRDMGCKAMVAGSGVYQRCGVSVIHKHTGELPPIEWQDPVHDILINVLQRILPKTKRWRRVTSTCYEERILLVKALEYAEQYKMNRTTFDGLTWRRDQVVGVVEVTEKETDNGRDKQKPELSSTEGAVYFWTQGDIVP